VEGVEAGSEVEHLGLEFVDLRVEHARVRLHRVLPQRGTGFVELDFPKLQFPHEWLQRVHHARWDTHHSE
jgi:hypothetical protein